MGKSNHATFEEEKTLWNKNHLVIGIDEVGRGCFAGPVVTAAVVFPKDFDQQIFTLPNDIQKSIALINDSKLVPALTRINLAEIIKQYALAYTVSVVDVQTINRVGIGKATQIAFRKSLNILVSTYPNTYLLVDGFHVKYIPGIGLKKQKAIIKGDQKSISIAAASIIAKVHRDHLMTELDKQYPSYGFATHKGYGTKSHQEAMKQFGLSKLHRTSFDLTKFL